MVNIPPTPVGWRQVDWETHCRIKQAREEHARLWAASTPPVTIDQVLAWLPPSIREEFDCEAGPHQWLGTTVPGKAMAQFCKLCNRRRWRV